jgi:hypothetical protein
MKLLSLVGTALLLGGCALFSGGGGSNVADSRSEDAPAAASPARTATAESFRPAYGIGRPVALVPCGRGAKLSDDCAGGNTRHQLGGEGGAEGEAEALSEVSLVPVAE